MSANTLEGLEVGYDVPALPGMDEADIQTPCLVLDLDALERNVVKMGEYAKAHGMRHRAHGKMHKSVDVAKLQERLGGAVGVCCQKVSEAEVFARGGIKDILISNQVRDPQKIDRLARLPKLGPRIIVCDAFDEAVIGRIDPHVGARVSLRVDDPPDHRHTGRHAQIPEIPIAHAVQFDWTDRHATRDTLAAHLQIPVSSGTRRRPRVLSILRNQKHHREFPLT